MPIFPGHTAFARVVVIVLLTCGLGVAPSAQAQVVRPALAELLARGTVDSVTQPDGKLIAYGSFDKIGSVPRRNIARFNVDGSLDMGWAPDTDGFVRTVVVDASNNIFVAGDFKRIAGRDLPYLAKLLPGPSVQPDPAYASGLPGTAVGASAIVLANDGSQYVSWNAPSSIHGVSRLLPNGANDAGFAVGANNFVFNLALSPDQQSLFVSGLFTQVNATATSSALAKVNAGNGALDTGWTPLTGTTANVRVRDMLVDGTDHLLLAGTITAYPTGFLRVAMTGSGTAATWGPAFTSPSGAVQGNGLARFPDGDVLAVGTFIEADGTTRGAGVARLAPDGSLRSNWGDIVLPGTVGGSPNGSVDANGVATIWRFPQGNFRPRLYQLSAASGTDLGRLAQSGVALTTGAVNVMRRQTGSNRIFLGGALLSEVDGRISLGAVALQPNLRPDTTWTSRLSDDVSIGGTAALAVGTQSVFLGSFGFSATISQQLAGLNRLDGNTGAIVAWQPRANVGTGMAGSMTPTGVALDEAGGFVYASSNNAMRDATTALVGNGNLLRFALTDGIVDLSWNPAFTGTSIVTPAIAIDANYLYYATNRNVTASDASAVASLARIPLVGNGRADPTWKPLTANAFLRAMTLSGGHGYFGGDNTLQRVDLATGVVDAGWVPTLSGTYSVRDISVALDGSVYLAGSFPTDCLGAPTSALRLASDGSVDTNWGVNVDAAVTGVLALPDGSVLLSGGFRRINSKTRTGVAHLFPSSVSEYCLQQAVDTPVPQGNNDSIAPSPSGSGRFIAFQSQASNLDGTDAGGDDDIYRVDTECVNGIDGSGAICERLVRASLDNVGKAITGNAVLPSLSADGQLVAFVAEDAGVMKVWGESKVRGEARRKAAGFGVYLRNMISGNTFRMGSAPSLNAKPEISPSGNAVVFTKPNAALDPGSPGQADIYVMPIVRSSGGSTTPGALQCISCKTFGANGVPTPVNAEGDSENPVVSADGNWVAWQTKAKNMLPAASPCIGPSTEIILRNLLTGVTQRMGSPTTAAACGTAGSAKPDMDYTGGKLVFESDHPLVGPATGADVFIFDVGTGTQERISAHPDGGSADGVAGQAAISGDGETVAFVSAATNLDPSDVDGNGAEDIFVYSPRERLRRRLARTSDGEEADRPSLRPALSYSGSKIVFDSTSGNLSPDSVADQGNVYQRGNPIELEKVFRAGFE